MMCSVFPVIDLRATGRAIKLCREAAGLTEQDVQNYFGFEYPQAVYKWQQGKCLPSVDNLLALSRLLRVPMEDLLVYEDQEVPLVFGAYFLPPCAGIFFAKKILVHAKKHPVPLFFGDGLKEPRLPCAILYPSNETTTSYRKTGGLNYGLGLCSRRSV